MTDKPLYKCKSVWAAASLIISSAAAYFTGEATLAVAIQGALTGVIGIFLRDGMRTDPAAAAPSNPGQ